MLILSTTIRGFGPHDETTVDWSAVASPAALCAPNGSGKTYLMEGALFALYGKGAFRNATGSIYDEMTLGGNGIAGVEVVFEYQGERYLAKRDLRTTAQRPSQKAVLYRERDMKALAGPKVKDFDLYVAAHFGTYEDALATWFLSQNCAGDLIGQVGERDLVPRRREAFGRMINVDRLDSVEERLARVQNDERVIAEEEDRRLAAEDLPTIESVQNELLAETETRNLRNGQLSAVERDLEAARTNLRDAQGDDAQLHAQIERYDTAEAARVENVDAMGAKREELAAAVELAATVEERRADAHRLEKLRGERDDLEAQEKKHRAWASWDRERYDTQAEINNKLQVIENAERFTAVSDEDRELAGRVESLRADYAAKKTENEDIAFNNSKRSEQRTDLRMAVDRSKANVERIEKQLAEKPETPFGDDCAPCPLMQAWASLPDELASEKAKIQALEDRLSKVEPDETPHDLEGLIADGQRARAAADKVAKADEWRGKIDKAKEERDALDVRLSDHMKAEPEKVEDPAEHLATVRHEIDKLSGAEERLRAAEDAATREKALRAQLEGLAEKDEQLTQRAQELRAAADSARESLAGRDRQREDLKARVQKLESDVSRAREAVTEADRTVARIEQRIADLEGRYAERQTRMERARELRSRQESLSRLRQTFGKRGFRQLMIDEASLELEAIANDLFMVTSGGKMCVRIATQTLLKDEVSTREDFAIMVRDARGERDALQYSGGEGQMIRIIFRVSVALWLCRFRGAHSECLFLDEAFDDMDHEHTDALLRLLDYLADRIPQIVVVTHDRAIADRMPGRVYLEKRATGVEVMASGETAGKVAA